MKKAKIFLTVLIILALVGGVLAFKAKVPKLFGYCNTNSGGCDLNPFTSTSKTTNVGGNLVNFDEITKRCKYDAALLTSTCKTLITIGAE